MARIKKTENINDQQNSTSKKGYIFAVGRRKEAVARVRLYTEKEITINGFIVKRGEILVNNKPAEEYFNGNVAKVIYLEPFRVTNTINKFATTIKVRGGGKEGQLEAVVHGLARALVKFDKENFRSILKKKRMLTRDARTRERRKVGTGGKARRKKQSPKR